LQKRGGSLIAKIGRPKGLEGEKNKKIEKEKLKKPYFL
jgi:hypothetical protein